MLLPVLEPSMENVSQIKMTEITTQISKFQDTITIQVSLLFSNKCMKIQPSSTSKKADEQEISIAIKKLDADKP